jgi:CHAT domain-containing protein
LAIQPRSWRTWRVCVVAAGAIGAFLAAAPPLRASELRLSLPAGTYVRLTIAPAPVDLVLRELAPAGSTSEELRLIGTGAAGVSGALVTWGAPLHLSFLAATAGEYSWTLAADPVSPLPYAFSVEEVRPADACDAARVRGERALLQARVELALPAAADRAAALLAEADRWYAQAGDDEAVLTVLLYRALAARRAAGQAATLALYTEAAELARRLGNGPALAMALQERAALLPANERLAPLQTALELRRQEGTKGQVGEEPGLAQTLFTLGVYHAETGDSAAALDSFRQALGLEWRNDDVRAAAWTLGEIGALEAEHGDPRRARAYLDLAASVSGQTGDRKAQAHGLEKSAAAHVLAGELAEGYDDSMAAYRLQTELGDGLGAAWSHARAANAALYLGEPAKAREIYTAALASFDALQQADGRAAALLGIGAAFQAEGNPARALASFQQGLAISREHALRGWEAVALYDLGKAYGEAGTPLAAIPVLQQALALQSGNTAWQARSLVELGKAYSRSGDAARGESMFRQAIAASGRAELVEAAAQAGLARLYRDRGDLAAARAASSRALEITEKLRAGMLRPDQRVSFLAARRSYYELNVDVLVRLDRAEPGGGHGAEALNASERARARGLLDLLEERRVEVSRGIPADLKQREEAIGERFARLQRQQLAAGSSRSDAETRALEAALAQAGDDERDLETEIRRRQASNAAVRAPRPLPLGEIQQLVEPRAALLEFFVGEEGSYLFVVTREGLFIHALPALRALAPRVEKVRFASVQPGRLRSRHYGEDAYELYRTLLAPAAEELRGKRRLLVAPDGLLHWLSFEALMTAPAAAAGAGSARGAGSASPAPLPYLLRERSISYVPSAGVLAQLAGARRARPQPAQYQFVGFGDPGQTVGRALPGARDEVARIAALFPAGASVVYAGVDASVENVKTDPRVGAASHLHFAAHGRIDEAQPELSGLLLAHGGGSAEDGLLQVREIFNLELNADLVVLSACQSGAGKEVSGEGLIGMTRAFLYAGAASVVVSLWQVDDESTADLMVRFYRHLRQSGDTVEALRSAKLEMIDETGYTQPYFWAPFVLVGQPR